MTDDTDKTPKSLYDANAVRPSPVRGPVDDDPGTTLTASVETIDNDRAAHLRGIGVF